MSYRSCFIFLLALCWTTELAGNEILFQSASALGTTLQIRSELVPLRINQIHSWEMRLTDAQGNPVSGAAIAITGGMPLHDHGLPTLPSVTAEPRAGSYLLEGVRFHMPGQWQLDIRVEHGSHIESFTVEFDL